MPKIEITILEKLGDAAGKTLHGFEVGQKVTYEDEEEACKSLTPALSYILPRVVLMAIYMLQEKTGGHSHKLGFVDKSDSTTLDRMMDELMNKLENEEFPEEIA